MAFRDLYYVDCEFHGEARRIGRRMGCLPKPPAAYGFGSISPIFEERFREKVIPRGEWRTLYDEMRPDYARHKTHQYDQNGEGTCTSNATGGCMSYVWSKQYGRDVGISPCPPSMYRYCASGPNSGSSTSCNMRRARDNGCLLIDDSHNRSIMQRLGLDPSHTCRAVGWRPSITPAMRETMRQFRVDEFYEISTVDGFFSALLYGFDILYGRSGHAIHGVDIVLRDGTWYCKYDNSWGRWGDNGFGYDSISYINRSRATYGAYAFQSMIAPDGLANLIGAVELS